MRNILSVIILFLSSFAVLAEEPMVVFDGSVKNQGKGFALPSGVSLLGVSHQNSYKNKMHLDFEAKFASGWAGCGWNWKSWEGHGSDLTEYKSIVFYLALTPSKVSDITFQLTSKNGSGESDGMGRKVSILSAINKRGKYVRITIPLEKLSGGNLDQKEVWGFNLGVFSGKSSGQGDCRIFIDQIEFIK